jgi:hypothetical protein
MVLPTQKLNYPFAAGIDQETDSRVVPQNLIGCRNGVWRRDGRLEKREGLADLLAQADLKGQQSLIIAGDKLATIGQNDFSVNDRPDVAMERISEQTGPEILRFASLQSTEDNLNVDIAYCGNYIVVVYSAATQSANTRQVIYYQVLDATTGVIIVPETLIASGIAPVAPVQVRVENATAGSATPRAHIFYLVPTGATFSLVLEVLNLDTLTRSGAALATISACAQNATGEALWHYDTSSQSGLNSVVVYWNDDAVPALTTKRISPNGAVVDTVTTGVLQAANRGQLCIYAKSQITDSLGAVILYQQQYNTTVPNVIGINTLYTAVVPGVATGMPILPYSALFLVRSSQGVGTARQLLAIGNDAADGFIGTERIQFSNFPLSMAFASPLATPLWGRVVGKPYYYVTQKQSPTPLTWPVLNIQLVVDSTPQPHVILVAKYDLGGNKSGVVPWEQLPIGRLNVETAQNHFFLHPKSSAVPVRFDESTGDPNSTEWLVPVLLRKNFRNFDTNLNEGRYESRPDILRVKHDILFPLRYAEQADNAYVAGGTLHSFTGGVLREQAFNFRPFITIVAAAGTGLVAGTYQYTAIFEQYDDRGDLIRSSPAQSRSITLAAPNRNVLFAVRLPVYVAGQGQATQVSQCRVGIFRTLIGGSLFFRVATIPLIPPAGPYTVWPFVTYTDSTPDSQLSTTTFSSDPLYTDSGELASDPPPAPVDVTVYQERIVVISGQDPDEVWISKQKAQDFAAEFSTVLRLRVPPGRGDLTACAAMDEKLVLFKNSAIYAVASEGPNAIGQGTFGQAREVSSDIGCNNKHSVEVSEAGIFFESVAGIYMLDRGLNLQFIGGPVVDLLPGLGRRVARAVSVQKTKEVCFLIQGTNVVLCYNYRWGRWTRHDYIQQGAAPVVYDPDDNSDQPQDIGVFDDRLVMLQHRPGLGANGQIIIAAWAIPPVYRDISHVDDGVFYLPFIPLVIQSPWFKFGGLAGWQRTRNIRFLADYASQHNLQVSSYHDNDDTAASGTWTFPDASLDPGAVGRTYTVKVKMPRQKSQSMRLEFEDTEVGTVQSGYKALELMLEYGVKEGGMLQGTARKV